MHKKRTFLNQTVFSVRDGRHTIAFGIYEDHTRCIPFGGVASKHPADKENVERGEFLAIGAAFRNLGRQMLKYEWETIKAQYAPRKSKTIPQKIYRRFETIEEMKELGKSLQRRLEAVNEEIEAFSDATE